MSLAKDLKKYTPRKEQNDVIDFIDKTYRENISTRYFLFNLPTGIGKSYLSIMIANWYRKNVDKFAKVDIVTNSKILQDQYADTFGSICDLKGKENYDCERYGCSCEQGLEFDKLNKSGCDECPYKTAMTTYIDGTLSLTNFYLYIINAVYNKNIMEKRDAKLLIVDEAHNFDDVMSNFITIKITTNSIKRYKFKKEEELIASFKKVSTLESYISFINDYMIEINADIEKLDKKMSSKKRNAKQDALDIRIGKIMGDENKDLKTMKMMVELKQLQSKLEIFTKEYANNPNNFLMETSYNEKTKEKEFSIEPLWAYDYLYKYVYSKYNMIIFMSGTILDKDIFCKLNGLDLDKTIYYSIQSPFDINHRPIYYMPVGKMSYAKKTETFTYYVKYIQALLDKYRDKKGIIHTNSFELAHWIEDKIKDNRLLFHDASNKDEVLKIHKESNKPMVLVSPSMDTGVSFDDDTARFQIIAKIPYPSLSSQKNKLRKDNYPIWYSWKTVAGIIQMCGRPIRNEDDYADTIIIDECFGDVMRYSSQFMPEWFKNAIKKVNIKR